MLITRMKYKLVLPLLFLALFTNAQAYLISVSDSLRPYVKMKMLEGATLDQDSLPIMLCSYDIVVNCGLVPHGARPKYDFIFKVTGKAPLIFSYVGWGEPMFAPEYNREPVKPGKYTTVTYSYRDDRPCPFEKVATIQTNLGTILIHFKGEGEQRPKED
jgi:hypothetical protein